MKIQRRDFLNVMVEGGAAASLAEAAALADPLFNFEGSLYFHAGLRCRRPNGSSFAYLKQVSAAVEDDALDFGELTFMISEKCVARHIDFHGANGATLFRLSAHEMECLPGCEFQVCSPVLTGFNF